MTTSDELRAENPYAGQGPVLLDIGGDVGALVVAMPARMDGVEVEIRPMGKAENDRSGAGQAHEHGHHQHDHDHHDHDHHGRHDHDHQGPGRHPHVAVVPRPVGTGVLHSLVYSEVRAGRYQLHPLPGGDAALEIEVIGGRVTEVSWPA